jgi:hypothetical protein
MKRRSRQKKANGGNETATEPLIASEAKPRGKAIVRGRAYDVEFPLDDLADAMLEKLKLGALEKVHTSGKSEPMQMPNVGQDASEHWSSSNRLEKAAEPASPPVSPLDRAMMALRDNCSYLHEKIGFLEGRLERIVPHKDVVQTGGTQPAVTTFPSVGDSSLSYGLSEIVRDIIAARERVNKLLETLEI